MRKIFNTDALSRILALDTIIYPLSFEERPMTQHRLEFETDRMREYGNPHTRVRYFNANVMDHLKPKANNFKSEPETPMTAKEIERETARLDALPKDEQIVIFCSAMGFSVVEYLEEKAKYNFQIMNDVDQMELEAGL